MAGCVRTINTLLTNARASAAFALLLGATVLAAQAPDFVHGEECLFCHRNNIGAAWQRNAHNLTTRQVEGSDEVLLGRQVSRRLKKTGYNRLVFVDGKSTTDFNRRCAGCHTTAVDPQEFTYSYLGIDCYSCHGAVDLKHSAREAQVPLGKRAGTDAKTAASICATCHLRGGPTQALAELNPADRHVYRAAADGACLNCHSIHSTSTERHRRVLASAICNDCHLPGQPRKQVREYVARHPVCEQ